MPSSLPTTPAPSDPEFDLDEHPTLREYDAGLLLASREGKVTEFVATQLRREIRSRILLSRLVDGVVNGVKMELSSAIDTIREDNNRMYEKVLQSLDGLHHRQDAAEKADVAQNQHLALLNKRVTVLGAIKAAVAGGVVIGVWEFLQSLISQTP
jgi:very-short-patch-repair endonuclease